MWKRRMVGNVVVRSLLAVLCCTAEAALAQTDTPVTEKRVLCQTGTDKLCAVVLNTGPAVIGHLEQLISGSSLTVRTVDGRMRSIPWSDILRAVPLGPAAVPSKVDPEAKPPAQPLIQPRSSSPPSQSEKPAGCEPGPATICGDSAATKTSPPPQLTERAVPPKLTCVPEATTRCMVVLREETVLVGELLRLVRGHHILLKAANGTLYQIPWAGIVSTTRLPTVQR